MAYFPHNEEDEFDNPRKNRFEDNYPVSRSRNYSPEDKDKITQRIIRYFEDPKEAKALAEIKKISMKAKKSSKNLRMDLGDFNVTDDLKNNTELNRKMFKQEGENIELEQPNVTDPFPRRKFKFSTQRYAPKNKNMTLIDEIKEKEKENKIKNLKDKGKYQKREEKKEYKPKRETKKIRFSVDNNKDDNDNSAQEKNNNKSRNYNSNTSNLKKPANSHASNLKKMKKQNTDNVLRNRFNERKPDYKLRNDKPAKIEIIEGSFNSIPDEYKYKNNATVENLHNKEKIIINEYPTKDKDKSKNYKTEYMWDKTIKRLVEKRTYLDKNAIVDNNDNKNTKYNNNSVTYRNRYKFNDDNDTKDKRDIEPENDKKEEKRKINLKYNIKKDKNNKEDDNVIEDRKRFGKNTNTLEKDNKSNKIDKNMDKNDEKEINNKTKEVNKNNRFYRRYKYNIIENKEEEKPKKEEKVINEKKVIEKEDSPEKEKQEEVSKPYKKIYQKRQNYLTIDPETNINIDDSNEKNLPEASPEKGKENENKFSRGPYVKPRDTRPKAFYTKKIMLEEVIPRKKEVIPEKKKYEKKEKLPDLPIELEEDKVFEKKPAKVPKIKPYSKYNNNIRLKVRSDNFDDTEDKEKMKNTPYSNYMKNKRKVDDKKIYRNVKTTSELIDDLEKIENYNINTYLKNDLLEIYDNINEEFNDFKKDIFYTNINSFEVKMGDFDKKKIPYTKKTRQEDDLYKGRVTIDDMYKKYSQKAKKYEKKKLFE